MFSIKSEYVKSNVVDESNYIETIVTTVRLFGILISRTERIILPKDTLLV